MRKVLLGIFAFALLAMSAAAQTADEIVAKYLKTIGGMDKVQALKSLRRTGKFTGGGGFEAVYIEENKRPGMVRQDFSIQGMTEIYAYDGKTGWKISPWNGKKDAEPLGEDELKGIVEDSDLDGALVNYRQKGNKVEFAGKDEFEGTDVYKLKVTLNNGTVRHYFMDTDYFVPIKIETRRMIRGAEQEFETVLGDYKEVNGVYFPFSMESGAKGSPNRSKITYEKIEANLEIPDNRFTKPGAQGDTKPQDADASKQQQPKKPAAKSGKKPAKR